MRVGRDQLTQRGGAGTRQADHEDRPLYLLFFDVGMLAVGGLDAEPGSQVPDQTDSLHELARVGEIGLVVHGRDKALQPFPVMTVTEIAQPGLLARAAASSSSASSVIERTAG